MQKAGTCTSATSWMGDFLTLANGLHLLTNARKNSILDITVVLDPPLILIDTVY